MSTLTTSMSTLTNELVQLYQKKDNLEKQLEEAIFLWRDDLKAGITNALVWVLQKISENTIGVGPYPIDLQIAELLGYSNNENFEPQIWIL